MALDVKTSGHYAGPLQNKPFIELTPTASVADQLTASKLNVEKHLSGLRSTLPAMTSESPGYLKALSMIESLELQSQRIDGYLYEDLVSRNPHLQKGGPARSTETKQAQQSSSSVPEFKVSYKPEFNPMGTGEFDKETMDKSYQAIAKALEGLGDIGNNPNSAFKKGAHLHAFESGTKQTKFGWDRM
jgi:hypothetical protein